MGKVAKILADRFWEKVAFIGAGPDDCWEWRAGKNNNGYGEIWVDGKMELAHRIAWKIHHGSIPKGKCVLHKYDNPSCVNPNHLWLGTMADNTHDMLQKGRDFRGGSEKHRGEANSYSKLTEQQVLSVPGLLDAGYTQVEVAEMLGVSQSAISLIKIGKNWGWLK